MRSGVRHPTRPGSPLSPRRCLTCLSLKSRSRTRMSQKPPLHLAASFPSLDILSATLTEHVAAFLYTLVRTSAAPFPQNRLWRVGADREEDQRRERPGGGQRSGTARPVPGVTLSAWPFSRCPPVTLWLFEWQLFAVSHRCSQRCAHPAARGGRAKAPAGWPRRSLGRGLSSIRAWAAGVRSLCFVARP